MALLGILLLGFVAPSGTVTPSYLYPHGTDAGDTQLIPEDDISSPEIRLRAAMIFYGQIYQSIFVSTRCYFLPALICSLCAMLLAVYVLSISSKYSCLIAGILLLCRKICAAFVGHEVCYAVCFCNLLRVLG